MEINRNYIAGDWLDGGDEFANINPSDLSDQIGLFAAATAEQVTRATEAAAAARPLWGGRTIAQRAAVLDSIGRELMARSQELGELLAREEGKTRAEGVGEVYRAGELFCYYAGAAHRLNGDAGTALRPDIDVIVEREAVGVVAVISPWNFPIATASWKIAPALAYGNSVIWKPASLTPASAVALAEIISRQDLPAGAFNLVMGSGRVVGEGLSGSPIINAVSFTGSLPAGLSVARTAAPNLTRVQLELGAKNALYVAEDADLDVAVNCAAAGAFSGTGQKCTASARIVVDRKVHDTFLRKFLSAAREFRFGHALDDTSKMGPLADRAQLDSVSDFVSGAIAEGAELLIGGEHADAPTEGYYYPATVLAGTTQKMRINREEVFGPVACILKADGFGDAMDMVNLVNAGLSNSIVTQSVSRARAFRLQSETGVVMVNLPTTGTDFHVPFSGRKATSVGPGEQASAAAEFYTITKTSYTYAGEPS